MIQPLSSTQEIPAAVMLARRVLPAVAITIVVAALIGAIALWTHYGTAVFFEMIVSGLEACF